ncbi:PfkB family carbohydrate kinase [Amphibacillus sp. Q70]|uniref:PfkB family carbohydrate kinase n=1 Tax=Amphibacillus sp. Q70 TaxID=3453416 RepID=UPI003F84301B
MNKIITFGEILSRLSTEQGQRLANTTQLRLHFGGAEANVAASLAQYGHRTAMVSRLPANMLSDHVINYLKSMNVNTDLIAFGGDRLGSYYLEVGVGNRGSKVVYDRKHSSFSQLNETMLDYERILKDATLIHVTGITTALSIEMVDIVENLFKEAKNRGILISFDFNYRTKLWSQKEAGLAFRRLLPYIDICSCAELDMIHLLGYPELDQELNYEKRLAVHYKQLKNDYPNLKLCISTKRNNISATHNALKGYLYADDTLYQSKTYDIDHIIDRVGGGDAFVAGILHGYINEWKFDRIISFATAASVLKHTILGDANLVTEAEVMEMIKGGNQISR